MRKYNVTNIEYDTDGEVVDLPTEMVITVPKEDEADWEEYLLNAITKETEFLVNGFVAELVKE
jgi:hypothetical protein